MEARAKALRDGLVDELVRRGDIKQRRVEAAFREIPRHVFVPGASLAEAYENRSIPVKTVEQELLISSSQPSIMALMLEQLALDDGHNVLEIGAGSGYNAALIARLVGNTGHVVTIDIDVDSTECARQALSSLQITNVEVITADGGFGFPSSAPYDRIIVTASAADIPPAWWEQLSDGGLLVVPLSLYGAKKLVTFQNDGGRRLRSIAVSDCAFIGLRGAFEDSVERPLRSERLRGVRLGVRDDSLGTERAFTHLGGPSESGPVAIQVSSEELMDGVFLWLALSEPSRLAKLHVEGAPGDFAWPSVWDDPTHGSQFSFGLIDAEGAALLDSDRDGHAVDERTPRALSIRCFGSAQALSARLDKHILDWVSRGRPSATSIEITAVPLAARETVRGHGQLVQLPNAALSVAWP